MEISLVVLLLIPYLVVKYYLTDHETQADKDRARFGEGIAMIANGKVDEAFGYFDRQVKMYPKSAVAYAYRGKCNLHLDNTYSAIYDLSQALSFDNTLSECFLDKGKAHLRICEYREAFRELDKAVWFYRNDHPEALRLRGTARLRLNQITQSERDFVRAVELGDEDSVHILAKAPFNKVLSPN